MLAQDVLCAFCGEGSDVQSQCGQLHSASLDEKGELTAHHKCMQYSSGLTQYTFLHFGGFHITEVQQEIKRGKKLACSCCKNKCKRGLKTSATAGCMLRKCNKTFHFFCAKMNALTSRRKRRTKKGKEIDLYRVFCSQAHKDEYLRSERGQQEYSCSETDEDREEQTTSLSKVTELGGGENRSRRLAQNKDANSKVCTKTDSEDSCKTEESGNSTSGVEEPSVPKGTSCQVKTGSDSSSAEFAPNINSVNSRWLSGAAQPQGSSLRSKRATKRKVTDSRESEHNPSLTLSSEKRKKACQSEAAVKAEDDREKVDKESTGVTSRSKKTEDSDSCSGSSLSASASQQASLTKSRTKTKARRRLSSSSVSVGETSDHEDFALQKNSGKRAESKARRRLSSSSVSLGETSDHEDFALQQNLAKRAKTPARRRLLSSLGDSSDLEDFDIQAVSTTPLMTTLETTSSSEAAACSPIAQAPQESADKPLARRQLRSAPHRNLTSSITSGTDLSDLDAFDLPNIGAGLSGSAGRGKVKTPQTVAAYSESMTKVSTKRAEAKCSTSLASVPHCVVVLSDLKDSGLLDFGAVSVSENKLFQTNLSRARVTRGERVKTDSQQKPVSVSKSVFSSSDGEDVDLPSVDLRARVKVKHEPQPPVPSSDTGLSGQEDGSPDVPCTKQMLPDVYSDKTSSQSKSRNESRFRSEEQVKSQDAEQTSLPHTTRFTNVVSDQTGTSGEDESEMEGHSAGMNTSEPALPQEDKAKDVLDQPSDLSEPSTEIGAVSVSAASTDEISEEAPDRELGQPGRSRLRSTDQELSEEPQSAAETQEDCVLLIPADASQFMRVAGEVQATVGRECGVDRRHVHLWNAFATVALPADCMLYFFRDIANAMLNRDWCQLRLLLLDVDTVQNKYDNEYAGKMTHQKKLTDIKLKERMITTLVELIVVRLSSALNTNGEPLGKFTSTHGVNYLTLFINSVSDPENHLRSSVHEPLALYQWTRDEKIPVAFAKLLPAYRQSFLAQEMARLQHWFSENFSRVSKVVILPEEDILKWDSCEACGSNPFSLLRSGIEECQVPCTCRSDLPVVVFIERMNSSVVLFEGYLQAYMNKFITELPKLPLIFAFPAENLQTRGFPHLNLGSPKHHLKLCSAFNPSEKPITFVLAEIKEN